MPSELKVVPNYKAIGGILLAFSISVAIWWALFWGGLEGYKHVNSWIDALLGVRR